jgi:hypothetical protein
MLTRRTLLQTGGASILVLSAGWGISQSASGSKFRQPWEQATEGFGDVRLNALAYAILAPNPHNRQPWVVKLDDNEQGLTLYCDLDRRLPETDPPNRQITIGMGAFLELFKQAAAQQGYAAHITPFPEGEPHPVLDDRPIAHIKVEADPFLQRSPLFDHILARRTVRSKFKNKPITETHLIDLSEKAELSGLCQFSSTTDVPQIERLKTYCLDGWRVEVSTSRTHHESTALTRIGAKEVAKNPDGISLLGPMMETYHVTGLLRRDKMNTPGTSAYEGALSFYNKLIESAGAFGWLSTPGNSRLDQLNAGADWARLNLAATKLGIAMHPLSQVLQEFPEMDDLYAGFHKEVGIKAPARVQGLFRFGFADYPKASPRWPMESSLTNLAT